MTERCREKPVAMLTGIASNLPRAIGRITAGVGILLNFMSCYANGVCVEANLLMGRFKWHVNP
jgi:hypothetical protein